MFWVLLFLGGIGTLIFLLEIAFGIYSRLYKRSELWRYGKNMIICIVLGVIGFLGLCDIGCHSYEEVSQTADWELVSITTDGSQNSTVNAYVQTSIDSDNFYSFYYKVNDGGIKKGKADAYATIIRENDDCIPHIVEYTTYSKNKLNIIIRIIFAFGFGEGPSQKTYEIYIPTGSVLSTFNLDTQ